MLAHAGQFAAYAFAACPPEHGEPFITLGKPLKDALTLPLLLSFPKLGKRTCMSHCVKLKQWPFGVFCFHEALVTGIRIYV